MKKPLPPIAVKNPLIEAERQLDRCETWIRHSQEHPGFVDRPSLALWEALAAAQEATALVAAEYHRLRTAGR